MIFRIDFVESKIYENFKVILFCFPDFLHRHIYVLQIEYQILVTSENLHNILLVLHLKWDGMGIIQTEITNYQDPRAMRVSLKVNM